MNIYDIKLAEGEIPKYIQVYQFIKAIIDKGQLKEGEKLPTIREFSANLNVNKITIVNAYKKLEEEGYITQKAGSGSYVQRREGTRTMRKHYSDILKKISPEDLKNFVDFTGETTAASFFPLDIFKGVLNNVLERDGVNALIYHDFLGFDGLREGIVKFFWNSKYDKDDILIVSGAQQGIDIITKALINNNDNIVVERPTYSGALSVFTWRRANIFEIDMESDGINIEQLEKVLKKNRIKFIYIMSYFQNPTSMTYSMEKKQNLLYLADKYDFYIIEDDYLSELIYSDSIKYNSLKSMDNYDRVIYIKSFSKLFLPGIRLGYIMVPDEFKEIVQNVKFNSDIATSSLMQRALGLYLNTGYWVDHINYLKDIYFFRYKYMLKLLDDVGENTIDFKAPGGGLNFYIKIRENIELSSMDLFYECKKNNVLITPGGVFYRNFADGNKYFRIGFSQTDETSMEKGIDVIKNILFKYRK